MSNPNVVVDGGELGEGMTMWAHIAHDVLLVFVTVLVVRVRAELRKSKELDKILRAMDEGTAEVTKITIGVKKEDRP